MEDKEKSLDSGIIQTFHIGTIQQMNPVAKTVVNYYYGTNKDRDSAEASGSIFDKETLSPIIIDYVEKTLYLVSDAWRDKYLDLWKDILKIEKVEAEVYIRGKQRGTLFNRALVANIMHFLGNYKGKRKGMFKEWDAKQIAIQLEGTWECSTRIQLGIPPSTAIQNAILKLIDSPEYRQL